MLFLQLCESKRRGQPGGAAANDQDIDVEGFAMHERTNFIRASEIFVGSYFPSSATIAGTISNKSPTMP